MPPSLTSTKAAFQLGQLDRYVYSEEMHKFHSLLFEYSDLIRGGDVRAVEVLPGKVVVVSNRGVRFGCDTEDRYTAPFQLLNFGTYEPTEWGILEYLISPTMNVFDVGANVGWYSLNIACIVPAGHVFAFEPVPSTFEQLKSNVVLNDFSNVSVHGFGISDHEGADTFYVSPEMSPAASAARIKDVNRLQEICCHVRRLDDVWNEIGATVDFIKCDVEGAELLVLRGGTACIQQCLPIILCEMLRKWSAKFGYHPNEIIALLEGFGYECYEVAASGLRHFYRMDENTKSTNFVFLHRDRHSSLIERSIRDRRLAP